MSDNQGVVPFYFRGAQVRTVTIEGATYFVGIDVCERLGYANPSKAMADHCRGITKRYPIPDALGRVQETRVLVEPDVLRLIIGSNMPAAVEFERWVFEDVLPTIRRTGSYEQLEITEEGLKRFATVQQAIVREIVSQVVMPVLADMRSEYLRIAGGHDPALHSVRNMRLMVEHLQDLKIPAKGRRVLSSKCSQRVLKYAIKNGKRDLIDTNYNGKYLFHVTLLRAWMEFEGDVIIREWREKTMGQTVFDFAAAKSKKNNQKDA